MNGHSSLEECVPIGERLPKEDKAISIASHPSYETTRKFDQTAITRGINYSVLSPSCSLDKLSWLGGSRRERVMLSRSDSYVPETSCVLSRPLTQAVRQL